MKWVETYNQIETFKGDYGREINFNVEDFLIGDKIIFVFENDIIPPKEFTVNEIPFNFTLEFSEEDIANLEVGDYKYSVKQYRDLDFLETLFNGIIKIKESEKWQQ